MAPAQMEQKQEQTLGQGYTHKKFNCGYAHKKLGLRFRQREPVNNENMPQPQREQVKIAKIPKDIFRPYALDESKTSKKRKVSRSTEEEKECLNESLHLPAKATQASSCSITNQQTYQRSSTDLLEIATTIAYPFSESCSSPALSHNSYNMRLHRQKAALNMPYVAFFQNKHFSANLQTAAGYPMGYPNITAPIFNGC